MDWYYATKTGERLAVQEPELDALVRSGAVTPTTLLWSPGETDWRTASEVKPELFGAVGGAVAPVGAVSRAALEPLANRRGWLVALAIGVWLFAAYRAWIDGRQAWPDLWRTAGVLLRLVVWLVLVAGLFRWAWALGRVSRSGSLEDARDASRTGGWIFVWVGLVGVVLGLSVLYDWISLAAHAVSNR